MLLLFLAIAAVLGCTFFLIQGDLQKLQNAVNFFKVNHVYVIKQDSWEHFGNILVCVDLSQKDYTLHLNSWVFNPILKLAKTKYWKLKFDSEKPPEWNEYVLRKRFHKKQD